MRLKMLICALILFFAPLLYADSTQITVNATATSCQAACGFPFEPWLDLQAQMILEQVTGTFFNSGQGLFTGSTYEVMSLIGTLNGSPITLAAPPFGMGSWLNFEPNGQIELGTVYFIANGSYDWLENDNTNDLLEITVPNDGGTNNVIAWTAVDPPPTNTPEPSALVLSGMGILSLISLSLRMKH